MTYLSSVARPARAESPSTCYHGKGLGYLGQELNCPRHSHCSLVPLLLSPAATWWFMAPSGTLHTPLQELWFQNLLSPCRPLF